MRPVTASVFRTTSVSCRYIHATPLALKSVKEKILSVADKINKKVGKDLASAIETGEKATERTKEALETTAKRTKDRVKREKEKADEMGQKTKDVGGNVSPGAKDAGKSARKDQ